MNNAFYTWEMAMDWVSDRLRSIAESHPGERLPKYRIHGVSFGANGWRYFAGLSPCPECNPPSDVFYFLRVTFVGTVWHCKKHQAFWDEFNRRVEREGLAKSVSANYHVSPTFDDRG